MPRRAVGPKTDADFAELTGVPTEADVAAAVGALTTADQRTFAELRRELAEHLGSYPAFRVWLLAPDTGFGGKTAAETIRDDKTALPLLLAGVRDARGLSPTYG